MKDKKQLVITFAIIVIFTTRVIIFILWTAVFCYYKHPLRICSLTLLSDKMRSLRVSVEGIHLR